VHRAWVGTGEGEFEVRYRPNVACDDAAAEAVAAAFTARLAAQRGAEQARRVALIGPHRDEIEFALGGSPLDVYGSQGQQRTAVLALKVAEYQELEARGGEAPLLLLDDVLSELDRERRRAFLHGVASVEQAFITATSDVGVPVAATYRVRAATVEREAA
jgi:DNA replication and repair protein RecF